MNIKDRTAILLNSGHTFLQDNISPTPVFASDGHELGLRSSLKNKSSFPFKPSLYVM